MKNNYTNETNQPGNSITIRSASMKDLDEVLRINEESVHFLSPLTKEKLKRLIEECELYKIASCGNDILAFYLAFRECADYDSINYLWFQKNYKSFLYVDRIVVDLESRGLGIGYQLYKDIFLHASKNNIPIVTAEIDIEPPNPTSLEFHRKLGFREVGQQEVAGGKKIVSLQIASATL